MQNNVKYVVADSGMLDKIYALDNTVFDEEKYSRNMIADALYDESYIILVASIDDDIIGYIMVSYVVDEAELQKICVSHDNQRSGVGYQLLSNVQNLLSDRGIKTLYLEVRKDNTKAINFYEKNGFEIVSIREKYYGDVDAVIYRKGI